MTDKSEIAAVTRLCRERAESYGALRQSSPTAIALDRAADLIDRLTSLTHRRDLETIYAYEAGEADARLALSDLTDDQLDAGLAVLRGASHPDRGLVLDIVRAVIGERGA